MLLFAGFGAPPFLSCFCKSVCFLAKFSEADACERVPAPIGSTDRPYSASRTMIAPQYYSLGGQSPPPQRAKSVGGLSPYAAPNINYTPPFSASCGLYRPHRGNASPSARAPRAAVPFAFRSSLCLFRHPPSSGRRYVQFSSLFITKLRRVVRSFPSADPASPFARLCDYRLSPIKRLAAFRRTRFMHRIIRRQTHYRLQCKFNRSDKCTFKNLQRYPYRLRCAYLPFPRLRLFVI